MLCSPLCCSCFPLLHRFILFAVLSPFLSPFLHSIQLTTPSFSRGENCKKYYIHKCNQHNSVPKGLKQKHKVHGREQKGYIHKCKCTGEKEYKRREILTFIS
jgi:hypothetical protein